MGQANRQNDQNESTHHADRSVWMIWLGLVLLAVAVLPFALRNSAIAVMCGFL